MGFKLNLCKLGLQGTSSRHSVSMCLTEAGSGESFSPRCQGLRDRSTCLQSVLPVSAVILSSVCLTLQLHGPDQPVFTTESVRPVCLSLLLESLSGFFRQIQPSSRMPLPRGVGTHMGDSQISGTQSRTDTSSTSIKWSSRRFPWLCHCAPVLQGRQVKVAIDNSSGVHPQTM